MTLRLQFLGSTQVSYDDEPVEIPGYRPLALLAYLAVTGQAHSRQHLVDLLFESSDDPKAGLRWTLSKLRQALGADYLLADRQTVSFNVESDYWLDVAAFESGQLELYRGDFLEGLAVREAFRFEDWAFFERERLKSSYQQGLTKRLEAYKGAGEDEAVVETAHQLLRLDNLREDWYRALMAAYARLGKREAALAQFEQCRQVLQAELGVEPVAETVALAAAIRQGDYQPSRLAQKPGRPRIAGRFTIVDRDKDLLGQGGMGDVYRGLDTETGRPVAIKLLKPEIAARQPELVKRFLREGEALRRLNHPNIVKMLATTEIEGQHYLVMEYIEGGSLRDLLEAQGRLPLEQSLKIGLDLADALTRAHHLKIIHRDLKPANVLLAPDGAPQLADFGIARLSDSPPLTETGLVLGSVDYLSPEACQGERLDGRSDIWALGVILYEMLTGQRPFSGESMATTLAAIVSQPAPDPRRQRPDIPEALARLINRMLAKEPRQRLSSARLVGAELEAILQGKALPGRDATLTPPPPRPPAPPLPRFPTSLVGRTAEMATLRQVWQQVIAGCGQIALIEGEPGIGKTRLIEELLAEVGQQAAILRAKAPEMQNPLAYTLFVDPLRQALSGERPPGLSDTWLAEVSRLLPELRDRYPDLPRPAALEPAAERRRLFDAICASLLSLAAEQPLLFFVDDLQWADATSLELLNHLSGWMADKAVLIIGAYRPYEVEKAHPLQEPRRAWQRAGVLTHLALPALSDEAVAGLLRELTTWRGEDPSFGQLIFRETAGNPLFVVETVANLRDEGRLPQDAEGWRRDFRAESLTIPSQVQTLIEARLNRLDELSRQIITTAAVMRSSFRADTVQTVSGRNEWETLDGLEHLLAGGLLVEQGAEQFTFSHDKIREVAYGSLSQLRRKLLHRRVAETVEKQHHGRENTVAGRLAYHYEQAGVQDKALAYHLQAGQNAKEQYAHEAAIEHYQQAVTLLKAQQDFEQAAQISMQLGLVQHQVFDFQGAQQAYEEAFALRQQVDRPQRAPAPPSSSSPHPLRIGWGLELLSLDPMLTNDASKLIIEQLFSGLVESTPEMDVIPDVARRWQVLDGGRKYVFYLRDDARWSDGVPVTAHDFVYAWKRVLNPATGSPIASLLYDVKGARAFHRGEVGPEAVGVRATDALTLVIELEGPAGYFLSLLTHNVTYPVPRHIVKAHGEDWTAVEKIVTNGPFKLEDWRRDERLVLTRNESYHGRFRGNVSTVELVLLGDVWNTADRDARSLALYKADNLDMVGVWETEVDLIRQQYSTEHVSFPTFWLAYVGLNPAHPPFNDLRVRRAFALAIDQERFAQEVWKGLFTPAQGGFIPPGLPGHTAGIGLPYSPPQAQRLLAEAGYPEGHHLPRIKGLGGTEAEIENLRRQWRENLGVEVEWQVLDYATVEETLKTELPSLYIMGAAADYPDPDNFLRVFMQQMYHFNWRNEVYENLVEEAKRLTDQNKRLNLYRQADLILVEDVPLIPLIYIREHFLVKPWVRNYLKAPTLTEFWKDVIIEPHEAQPSPSPSASHTLKLAQAEPTTLDPIMSNEADSFKIIKQLFSGLAQESSEIEVLPDLAHRWEVLAGGQQYIFHLRAEARWSDNTALTAADFEYGWKRALDPAVGSPNASLLYDIKGARAFHQGLVSDPDQIGVHARDDLTLVVDLERPTSYFLHLMTCPVSYPLPRHVVASQGERWATAENIVSNGPFRLAHWKRSESMHLTRNPTYHGHFQGNVTAVEISLSSRDERSAELGLYEADRLDVLADFISTLEMDRVRQQHAGEYHSGPSLQTDFLGFDVSRPPFNDPRVRLAFALAVDRKTLADVVMKGYHFPASGGFIPVGLPGHSAGIGLSYDPVRAQQLLAEAGYPQGRGFPKVEWLITGSRQHVADYLQAQWRENLGIAIDWEAPQWTALLDRLKMNPPNLFVLGWHADYADPNYFLRVFFQYFQKTTSWRHEPYEQLVEKASRITDQKERLELYRQADKILVNEAPLIPLTYKGEHTLVKPWIKNYPPSITTGASGFCRDLIIEPHDAQPTRLPPASYALRTTAEGEPHTLDPTLCTETTSGIIIGQLFSGLVTETPGMEFVPDVAQRWEILADGRNYIFHLRSDAVWSDGVPVTATDFEYAWKRVLNPATGAVEAHLLYDVKGAGAFHQGQVSNPDSVGVSALDQHTLVIQLERPAGYFLNLLANPITFPVPQHVVKTHGEAWTAVENIVTNGPFKLEAWRKGEVMSLRRNRAYHGLFSGNVERVEVFFSRDDLATELTWYEAGRLDVTRLPSLKGEANQQRGGEYITHPTLRTFYLDFDKSRPPFDDLRVRQAFTLAIDRQGLPDTFTEIYGVPATGGFCPPGMPGHSAGIGLPYDPAQARQLLAEAGYPEGRNFPEFEWLIFEFLEPLAGYLQEQWQTNLGIGQINKKSVPIGVIIERSQQEQPSLLLVGWVADYPDPDTFLRACLQQQLLPGWRNETFERLVERAGRSTDQRQRLELYQQADKILIEEAALMPLTYGRLSLLVKPWVKQYAHAPHRRVFWQDVIIEPH